MKKIISLFFSLILVVTLYLPAMGAEVTSFSDVPSDYWAYQDIMAMVQQGLFNGTSDPDENGVATFSPEQTMTRAEFIAVLVRHLFPNEQGVDGNNWWDAEMSVAINHSLISASDFDNVYDNPCSRQEMAYILINAARVKGESLDTMDSSGIPDYDSINSKYQDSVLQAVRAGLITGMDDAHTFSPNGTMIRAQGATVLNRLLDASRRADTSWIGSGTSAVTPSGQVNEWGNVILSTKASPVGNVTTDRWGNSIDDGQVLGIGYNFSTHQDFTRNNVKFNEGSKHPVPVQGDIVVKADGTEVTIDFFYGILRAPLCDIWTGACFTGANGTDYTIGSNYNLGFFTGDMSGFAKSPVCGEMYTETMWDYLSAADKTPRPSRSGSYDRELVGFWMWSASENTWFNCGR